LKPSGTFKFPTNPSHPILFSVDARQKLGHYTSMVGMIFRVLGALFGLAAAYAIWLDVTSTSQPSIVFGQFWFDHSSGSLQVAESIISRYVDPCSLIMALGCAPFLWHPLIATTLGWPAALVFLGLMLVFFGLARLFRGRGLSRTKGRALKRSGEK